jgi:hypothetical protein
MSTHLQAGEKDRLRKDALAAAFGLTSLREIGPEEDILADVSRGLGFCMALRTYTHSPETPPLLDPEFFMWDAARHLVAGRPQDAAFDIDSLRRDLDQVEAVLAALVRGDEVDGNEVIRCQTFFTKASGYLE